MTKLAKIEVEFNHKWMPVLHESLVFCKGYWEHLRTTDIFYNYRLIDSKNNVIKTLAPSGIKLGQIAGLPTAQDYYGLATRALRKGLKYKDNRCYVVEDLNELVAQLEDIEQDHKDKECSTNVWINGQDPKENKND